MKFDDVSDYVLKFHKDFYNPIKTGDKVTTIRASSKPLNIDDFVFAYFPPDEALLFLITDHYAKQLKDLDYHEAICEGYKHPDLLKHELKNIYPNLKDNDYVYIYKFNIIRGNQEDIELCQEFLDKIREEDL